MSIPPAALSYLPWLQLLLAPLLLYVSFSLPQIIASNRLPAPADPGLASLPKDSRAREIYAEDWIEGGAYVVLPNGRVRYWLVGPESGRKITLIHGLTIPALVFAKLLPLLTAAGFRVLLYDLYGRGYSDAPLSIPYDAHLYVTQLALLLQHVGWQRSAIVGFSMGAPVAAAFVSTFPGLVEREVVFVATVGGWEKPFPRKPFSSLMRKVGTIIFGESTPNDHGSLEEIARLQSTLLPGFARAVASSRREGPVTRMHWAFGTDVWRGRRVLFVHGTNDPDAPPPFSPLLRSLVDAAQAQAQAGKDKGEGGGETKLVYLEGARHDVVWENAEEVGRVLIAFLNNADA